MKKVIAKHHPLPYSENVSRFHLDFYFLGIHLSTDFNKFFRCTKLLSPGKGWVRLSFGSSWLLICWRWHENWPEARTPTVLEIWGPEWFLLCQLVSFWSGMNGRGTQLYGDLVTKCCVFPPKNRIHWFCFGPTRQFLWDVYAAKELQINKNYITS